jgi:hypothetical protein
MDDLTLSSEIDFTIAIDTSTLGAFDHDMTHAVGQAQDKAQHARGFPDLATENEEQTIQAANTLASLLSKICTFNDFVAAIAEV